MRRRRRGPHRYRGDDPLVAFVVKIANETGQDPEKVAAQLDQAIDAGLLELTPDGLRAVIPGEAE